MTKWLCWHLPDGSPERGEEIEAADAEGAGRAFAEGFFEESEGDWMGGDVVVQELDSRLDAVGETVRFDADVSITDLAVTVKRR